MLWLRKLRPAEVNNCSRSYGNQPQGQGQAIPHSRLRTQRLGCRGPGLRNRSWALKDLTISLRMFKVVSARPPCQEELKRRDACTGNSHGTPFKIREEKLSLVYSRAHPPCNANGVCFFVYFNQEGKLVAKDYFDNEWKVSHDIFEGKKYK